MQVNIEIIQINVINKVPNIYKASMYHYTKTKSMNIGCEYFFLHFDLNKVDKYQNRNFNDYELLRKKEWHSSNTNNQNKPKMARFFKFLNALKLNFNGVQFY